MTAPTVKPGDRRTWKKVVSNYGHIDGVPVVVLSVGPRRGALLLHCATGGTPGAKGQVYGEDPK